MLTTSTVGFAVLSADCAVRLLYVAIVNFFFKSLISVHVAHIFFSLFFFFSFFACKDWDLVKKIDSSGLSGLVEAGLTGRLFWRRWHPRALLIWVNEMPLRYLILGWHFHLPPESNARCWCYASHRAWCWAANWKWGVWVIPARVVSDHVVTTPLPY